MKRTISNEGKTGQINDPWGGKRSWHIWLESWGKDTTVPWQRRNLYWLLVETLKDAILTPGKLGKDRPWIRRMVGDPPLLRRKSWNKKSRAQGQCDRLASSKPNQQRSSLNGTLSGTPGRRICLKIKHGIVTQPPSSLKVLKNTPTAATMCKPLGAPWRSPYAIMGWGCNLVECLPNMKKSPNFIPSTT